MFDLTSESKEFLKSFLKVSRIECFEKAYIVGSYDIKKTVATQQIRAAVLSLALHEKFNNNKSSVAVVGGGFAGITAAATLLKLGHKVMIFEQKCALLPKQKKCHDRYIHPDLYDWPFNQDSKDFKISGLSWKADYADIVCKKTIESFDSIIREFKESFTLQVSTTITKINEVCGDGKKQYNVYDTEEYRKNGFDAVLFCIGFGNEPRVPYGSRVSGYWENSSLSYMRGTNKKPTRILISGNGDSGLVSVLDCVLLDFDQANLLDLFSSVLTTQVIDKLRKAEHEIAEKSSSNAEPEILQIYDDYFGDYKNAWKEAVKPIVTDETHVTFNSYPSGVFSINSSPLNRFLTYVLIRCDFIKLKTEVIDDSMIKETSKNDKLKFIVAWSSGDSEEFDFVVVRHGVKINYFETSFDRLKEHVIGQRDYFLNLKFEGAIPDEILKLLRTL